MLRNATGAQQCHASLKALTDCKMDNSGRGRKFMYFGRVWNQPFHCQHCFNPFLAFPVISTTHRNTRSVGRLQSFSGFVLGARVSCGRRDWFILKNQPRNEIRLPDMAIEGFPTKSRNLGWGTAMDDPILLVYCLVYSFHCWICWFFAHGQVFGTQNPNFQTAVCWCWITVTTNS